MTKKYPLTFEEFLNIYTKVPRLCVDIVVKTPEGVVWTLRSIEPFKGMWHIPGGTVYFGEGIEDAAKRVALEELGIEIKVNKLLGYAEVPEENHGRNLYAVALILEVDMIGGRLRGSEQGEEVKVFPVSDLPENILEIHRDYIRKYYL